MKKRSFRASVAAIAEQNPQLRADLVPLLKAKTAGRVRDLGVGANRNSRPDAIKRIKQYVKWSQEILKQAEIGLAKLEKFAETTSEWPPITDAYDIAMMLDELEDVMSYWVRK